MRCPCFGKFHSWLLDVVDKQGIQRDGEKPFKAMAILPISKEVLQHFNNQDGHANNAYSPNSNPEWS